MKQISPTNLSFKSAVYLRGHVRPWDVFLEEFFVVGTRVQVDSLVQFFLQKRSDHCCAEVIEGRKALSINQSSFNSLNMKFISTFELKT